MIERYILSDPCSSCKLKSIRVNSSPVGSIIRPGTELLLLVDFPVIEDTESGLILSGITHRRARFIQSILKDAKIDERRVSYASVLRCITKSKSIISMSEYSLCSGHIINELISSDIQTVVSFGSAAGTVMSGTNISSVDPVRGKIEQSVVPGIQNIITYSLGVAVDGTGCNSCNYSNLYPSLILKDVMTASKDLKKRKIW